MKSLEVYRQTDELNDLLVDEASRELWIAESSKWRERAELRIESYPWSFMKSPTRPRILRRPQRRLSQNSRRTTSSTPTLWFSA